jgi:multicomponent Na+:H+ antiporter subunit B
MNSLIFRTAAPLLVTVMLVFSVYVLLRGHNEPGGGFIGGLIAAAAIAIYGMASGVPVVRKALRLHPITLAGFGVFIAAGSGLLSLPVSTAFLTGLRSVVPLGDAELALSTPLLFDIGVYFAVFGTLSAVALALEAEGAE